VADFQPIERENIQPKEYADQEDKNAASHHLPAFPSQARQSAWSPHWMAFLEKGNEVKSSAKGASHDADYLRRERFCQAISRGTQ
jgi:hypothetical protein